MTETKVNLGCGKCYIPGWLNIDLFSTVKADIYADLSALPIERGTVSLLFCSHLLEHCQRSTIIATLSHWRDLLKDGGVLRLAVPNFKAVCEYYQKTGDLKSVLGLLYGGQNHPKNNHFITFDEASLTEALKMAGFKDIRPWDWRTTEHAAFDDFSQAYLPFMQKETGLHVSLNLEATK
jgi:predicted SAM-dependent methyltransferase